MKGERKRERRLERRIAIKYILVRDYLFMNTEEGKEGRNEQTLTIYMYNSLGG